MQLPGLRLLRGPNLHAMQPCCVGVAAIEDGDDVAASQWPAFVERVQSALAGLRGIDAGAPTTLAHVAGQVAKYSRPHRARRRLHLRFAACGSTRRSNCTMPTPAPPCPAPNVCSN